MDSIREVRRAQLAGETGTFGPMLVYIVNFSANNCFPRRFFYRGCTLCSKTVDGGFKCEHKSLEKGTWTEMFRFDVFLVDTSINPDCPPLRAAIFDAASSLLGTRIEDFSALGTQEQLAIVHDMCTEMRLADVVLGLNFKRQLVVQELTLVKSKLFETPERGIRSSGRPTLSSQSTPTAYLTPRPGGETTTSNPSACLTPRPGGESTPSTPSAYLTPRPGGESTPSTPSAYLTPRPGGESTPSAYLTPRPGGESASGSSSTSGPSNVDLDSLRSLMLEVIKKLDMTNL